MKKVISVLFILVLCMSMAVTAFATDGFVGSIGEGGTPCDHENTSKVGEKDPTCTQPGYTGDTVCDDCGETLEEGTVIPATGHQFDENGVCIICGGKDVPQTGDTNHLMLWICLMVMSAGALAAIIGFRRKRA